MALESLNGVDKFIDDLVTSNPAGTDVKNQGDDHLRGIKNVLKNSFPNISAATSVTAEDLNFTKGLGAQTVTNKLIGGGSDSLAVAISVGEGLSMNASAGHLILALDNITTEQSVGASLNFNQVVKKTQLKGGLEVAASINASGSVVIDFGAAHFYHVVVNDCCTFETSNLPGTGLAAGVTIWAETGSSGAILSHAAGTKWAAGVAHSLTGSVGADDIVVYNAYGSIVFGFTGGSSMQ